ncbi:MAG: hypothetical protein ACTHN3_02715 [Solirubrobacterales bacterium]
MGVLASPSRADGWAVDPEALLLLTFEVGREEPRLFDEVLDWLLVNERLISLHRLRNLALDEDDRALSRAAIQWLSQWRRKPAGPPQPESDSQLGSVPLFLQERAPVEQPDPAFLVNGFLKSWNEPARRSGHPDLTQPINFAFRLRSLLGLGARAEVVRVLLTVDAPAMSLQAIAKSSGFTKRNVQEAAVALRAAGTATSWSLGNEQRFDLPRERWLHLLSLDRPPLHRDWPQLFRALRMLLRWLRDPETEHLSDYMRASEARRLVEEMSDDLRFAGVSVEPLGFAGDQFWPHFESWMGELGKSLR